MTQNELRAALLLMGFKTAGHKGKDVMYYEQYRPDKVFKVRFHVRSTKVDVSQPLQYYPLKWTSSTHLPESAFNFIKEKLT